MSKAPADEAARKTLLKAWTAGQVSDSSEMPAFRMKASKKDGSKYYLIQRLGDKRVVVGPITCDGKPCVLKRKEGDFNCTFTLSGDKNSLNMTMEDAKKSQPAVVTNHTLVGSDKMKIVQQVGGTSVEAEFSVTENVKSQEDEDL